MEQEGGGMNGDLISREAALDKLRAFGRRVQRDTITNFEMHLTSTTIFECINIVKESPAVDAEPVRHSRWKNFKKQNRAVCMACSFERNLDENFGRAVSCPNCGAKMRCNDETE